jgi:hypothetical protein
MRILNSASNTSCRNLTISSPSTFINASRLSLRTSGWLAQFNSPSKSTIKEGTNTYKCVDLSFSQLVEQYWIFNSPPVDR